MTGLLEDGLGGGQMLDWLISLAVLAQEDGDNDSRVISPADLTFTFDLTSEADE